MSNSTLASRVRTAARRLQDRIEEAAAATPAVSLEQRSALTQLHQDIHHLTVCTSTQAGRHDLAAFRSRLSTLHRRAELVLEASIQAPSLRPGPDTVNAGRYEAANARVLLNEEGLPVAFRRVMTLQGSLSSRFQVIRPDRVVNQPAGAYQRLASRCAPLN